MSEPILPQECEMLKALYDFEATFAKTLSFTEGDLFLLYQTSSKERNWWHVVNRKGQVGFVPSNYVDTLKVEPDFIKSFIDDCLSSITSESPLPSQKQELINRMKEKRRHIMAAMKPASKKPPAPQPPARFEEVSSPNRAVSPSFDLRPIVSEQSVHENANNSQSNFEGKDKGDAKSLPNESSAAIYRPHTSVSSPATSHQERMDNGDSEQIRPNAIYEIVQSVRKETQLSHELSKVAVETVLISLREFLPGGAARSVLDALLAEARSDITCPRSALDAAPDALRMLTALNALSKAANDAQQRGWALHDDAHEIQTQLIELISVMSNADVSISQHVLSAHRYAYVTILVQYYQMETRWPLRQLMLQAFGVMCGLERTALTTLTLSPLPAEIARDMQDNPRDVSRLSHSALLLSMVLSMGDKLPVTHYEQLGVQFAQFLLELLESPPDTDVDEQIPELFLSLLLAYNLQFGAGENYLLDALQSRDTAKTFTERVLLLLNREKDPVRLFDHEPPPPHAVLKLAADLFGRAQTAQHFYTNDVRVVIDIVVRQLADLSAGDQRRQQYLVICQRVLRHADYGAALHRRDDLLRCFSRIFCEDGEPSRRDQLLVRAISNEFPHYFKA